MNRHQLGFGLAVITLCAALVAVLARGPVENVVRTVDGHVEDRNLDVPQTVQPSEQTADAEGAVLGSPRPTHGAGPRPSAGTRRGDTTRQHPESALAEAPVGLHAPLHTDGNRIVDADGHPVLLRGIQRVGLQQPGRWAAITDAEIGHARAWGANVIRLPLGEAYTQPQCPKQYVPTYFDMLDAAVRSITSRGMVALLDLAFVTRTPCGDSFRWRMADMPGSVVFWETVASRYKTNPLVAFDLYNEPFGITDDQWRNGGDLVDWTLSGPIRWTAAGMQQLYEVVRSTGATNLITISGTAYGSSPSPILNGNGVTGANIVYANHSYTCSQPTGAQQCTSDPSNQQIRIDERWPRVAAHYPVMITEFGWPDPQSGTYNASVIRFAQSQNPPWGWIAFTWDGGMNGTFGLVANLDTYDPTPSGAPVKAALQSPP